MNLKIMSGIVSPLKQNGYVEIIFADHSIQHSSDANTIEKKTIGQAGNFKQIPTKTVALRQIKVQTIGAPLVGGPSSSLRLKIDDSCNKQRLKIIWSADAPSAIEEISYLAIGEV